MLGQPLRHWASVEAQQGLQPHWTCQQRELPYKGNRLCSIGHSSKIGTPPFKRTICLHLPIMDMDGHNVRSAHDPTQVHKINLGWCFR